MDKTIEQLSAQFPASQVKEREGGGKKTLLYLSIDSVMNRINETIPGMESVQIEITDKFQNGPFNVVKNAMANDKTWFTDTLQQYTVTVTVAMTINGSRRDGIGSDEVFEFRPNKYAKKFEPVMDMDKAWKTAYANAIKKAADKFGIGTYLWKEEERNKIMQSKSGDDQDNEYHADDIPVMKKPTKLPQELMDMIQSEAKVLGLATKELQDLVKEYMLTVHKKDSDGMPASLIAETPEETKKIVDGLITYLDNLKK